LTVAGQPPVGPAWGAAEQDSAFVRLWLGFATARVCVGAALLLLLMGMKSLGTPPPVSGWLLGMCATYLLAALSVRLLVRPPRPGYAFDPQWVSSIGVDLLVFAALQLLQVGGIYYAPLFAMPVLMAAVLGSTVLALGTAAGVALLLLAEAWVLTLQVPGDLAQRFLQAGLTGTGYFALAFLAHQLALRLAREEEAARASRNAAMMQVQVNQLVIDTLAGGVLVVDPDGHVHAANPAARELLGAPAATPLQLAAEPAWEPLVEMARRTFASGEAQMADIAVRQPGEAARQMAARTRLTAPQEPAGDSLCVVFLQDLREMEARLRTEKLAAMGRMSTAVAHEIRNPLAAISQANELLAEELEQPAHRQLSAMVRQNTQRLQQIVEEILDIARVQHQAVHLSTPAIVLDAVVHGHCDDWIGQHRSAQRVRLALAAPGSAVSFEPDHLRRVLVNLLDNALRYASDREDAIQVATDAGDTPTLVVWSDGARLDPAVDSHLFEPFFSSESRSSGLGLYICRQLCERHGASIGYRRGPAPGGDRRDGNAFFVAFRTAPPVAATVAFARMAA
jgi:two-component system sensor histidine kinase PilS (NtrC family)